MTPNVSLAATDYEIWNSTKYGPQVLVPNAKTRETRETVVVGNRSDGSLQVVRHEQEFQGLKPNPLKRYTDTTAGLRGIIKPVRQTAAAVKAFGASAPALQQAAQMGGTASKVISFIALPGSAIDYCNNMSNRNRPWEKKVGDTFEITSDVLGGIDIGAEVAGASGALPLLATATVVAGAVSDAWSGGLAVKDLVEAGQTLSTAEKENAPPRIITYLKEQLTLQVFKNIKKLATLAVSIIAVLAVLLPLVAPVPVLVPIILALVAATFGIIAHFYEDTRGESLKKAKTESRNDLAESVGRLDSVEERAELELASAAS